VPACDFVIRQGDGGELGAHSRRDRKSAFPALTARDVSTQNAPSPAAPLTSVWFAMRRLISASMLVFPKYARFLTSNVWISGRAAPSAICAHGRERAARGARARTHQPAEEDLDEVAVAVVHVAAAAAPVRVCVRAISVSRTRDRGSERRRTLFEHREHDLRARHVDLPAERHVREALDDRALPRLRDAVVVRVHDEPERRVRDVLLPPRCGVRAVVLVHRGVARAAPVELVHGSAGICALSRAKFTRGTQQLTLT
jgi:hypothetical protein